MSQYDVWMTRSVMMRSAGVVDVLSNDRAMVR